MMKDQAGSLAVEAALVAPVLLALMLLVVYAGRAAQADARVQAAAGRAARAASLTAGPATAQPVAATIAAANLASAGLDCQATSTTADTGRFHPGGSVTVTVACQVANRDLALLAVPGTRWSVATSTQVIDSHRGVG